MLGDRLGIDYLNAARAEAVHGERREPGMLALVTFEIIVDVASIVGVDSLDCLTDGAVEGGVGLGIDGVGDHLGTVIERLADDAAAFLLGQRDVGLGKSRRRDLVVAH